MMIKNLLKDKKVVLASQSPRRQEIFKMLGVKALIKPAYTDESITLREPRKLVIEHASRKLKEVAKNMGNDCLIVAADTIVFLDGKILGKPNNEEEAKKYLQALSGKVHEVYSGVCVCYRGKCVSGIEKTKVTFVDLTHREIEDYVKTGEPLDKAGAYGIQGLGSQYIKKINGCYFNVMGFPVNLFGHLLHKLFAEEK